MGPGLSDYDLVQERGLICESLIKKKCFKDKKFNIKELNSTKRRKTDNLTIIMTVFLLPLF